MTTQPPQQPGFPQQPGYPPPPLPQKKRSKAKMGCLGCGGILAAAIVIGGIAAAVGSGSGDSSPSAANSAASADSPKASGAAKTTGSSKTAAPRQSTADAFKAYVKEHESAKTRAAVAHVTKVQGADKNNDILDTADIYTDYTGDLLSADTGNAKLLASAFADFQSSRGKSSKNGLVTVYNADGDLLSNGKY
ncbi:hypothetical protein OG258_43195 [Streptomyces mirabilis]|uniref:hypothetical protein n=1 Tax=Streptomyces mirabilis TaxID=68239 RepID=UPI002E2CB366|nr:hypothetical protein [Streptomyces mirabilis]